MKKAYIYFAAALCLAACTQESPVIEENSNTPEPNFVTVSFSVTTENDADQEVKALIDQVGGTITWQDGDQIAIHTDNGNLAVLTYRTSHGKFTGSIAADDSISDDCIAYYPASIAVSGNESKVSLPNSYTSIQEAAKCFPLRGTVSGSSITLNHLGGIIRITLNNAPESLDKVVLTMPKNITGDFTVTDDSGNKVINAGASSDDVTINIPSSSRMGDDLVLLVPVPVGSYDGFNVEFYEGGTKLFEKGTANTITMARKQFRKMAAFNPEGDVSTEWRIYRSYGGSWEAGENNYVSLKEVIGQDNWLVARSVVIDANGFRFSKYDGSAWSNTNWGGSKTESLHTRYVTSSTTASRIRTDNAGTYDIYFNTSTYEFFLANAGDPWYRYIYLLPDKASDLSSIYWLHAWGANSEGDVTKWYGCKNSGTKTVNGAQYMVFRFDPYKYLNYSNDEAINNKNYLPNYALKFMLTNSSRGELYRFENGSLSPVAGTNVFGYQVSRRSAACGQFTNIEDPQIASGYRVLLVDDDAHSVQTESEYFTWTSEGLIAKNVSLSSTNIGFIITYNGSWSNPACGFDNTKAAEYFNLKGSDPIELSNVLNVGFTHFRFNSAQLPTTVDIKLDIYNNKVWILPHEL